MKRVFNRVLGLPPVRFAVMKRSWMRSRFRALQHSLRRKRPRPDVAAPPVRLAPKFVATDRQGFVELQTRANVVDFSSRYSGILQSHGSRFRLPLFCLCCNEVTPMLVDYKHCAVLEDGSRIPNWRERVVCPRCDMNNRQRLMANLVQQFAAQRQEIPRIYLMEQVTAIYEWVRSLPGTQVEGSEYLGPGYTPGQRVHGFRHEDVMDLSYPDESFDLIVSNDVMEHIPDPLKALRECFRVLKPGGEVLASIPFDPAVEKATVRAKLGDTGIEHLLPAQYHGNPLSLDGSLVFHDFGWDLLEQSRAIGYSRVVCEVYSDDGFGHMGPGLLIFRFSKPHDGVRD
jgi:SAM-dependent methyltransferase